jgi:hypothetical protein
MAIAAAFGIKERPIIFSGEMVNAIRNNNKTQTRRVIKPQFGKTWGYGIRNQDPDYYSVHVDIREPNGEWKWLRCPYGRRGDRLWVRETWAHDCPHCTDHLCGNPDHIWYRANETPLVADSFAGDARWRSPIHMPRWASRLTLEIVAVRVERLQDISDRDCVLEGCFIQTKLPDEKEYSFRGGYRNLWNLINGKRYPWDSNPWVWVVEFKRLEETP